MAPGLFVLFGALIGAAAAIGGVVLKDVLERRRRDADDAPRKALLLQMLTNRPSGVEWRKMETLSRVIGASREQTARLLISIGARGSEAENDVWALISEKPLP